ncbi:HPr family phosphocarrier protein [Sanguibacter antarcticus]|uniref:Phosphocarrier protein HPr n=1 Tax=Sanguibacter antarcticus TaxID=372484 RepID=A0A2A9E5J1_9MICO|nr:HPr family phosphocarrier protein [Sanguibacter antarcticus]PFG34228.1 phosphocarrier protein HPr [Sanguibacter antarcticus]
MLERHVTVGMPEGLHARPAALFVQLAGAQPADVMIRTPGAGPVPTTSILSVMTLGAAQGDVVVLTTETDDADAVTSLDALAEYLASDG